MKNYYEILGVSENVTRDVLDSVYKKLMEDVNNMSEEQVKEIQEAYYVLSNKENNNIPNNINAERMDINERQSADNYSGMKKVVKWIFFIMIFCIIVKGIKSGSSDNPIVKNNIWGTFESEDGETIAIEQKKDLKDGMYFGYFSSSNTPWIKESIILNLDKNTISYVNTVDEQKYKFEIKNKKLKFKDKTYKKISDECVYEKVLDKDKMSADDIVGTYKNAASYYVVIEPVDDIYVNVILCDNFGSVIGYTMNIAYDSFYGDGKVSVSIEDEAYDVYFLQKNIIKCEAYIDNYVKQEKLKTTADDQQDEDIDINTSELLSLDIIQKSTNNLLVNGAYKVKELVGEGLRSIDEFYIIFVTTPNENSIDNLNVILAFSYEYYKNGTNYSDYGRIAFTGLLNGENLELIQSEETTETLIDQYFSIVQDHWEGYQRLNENRNDCWYQKYDDGEIEYVYAIWDKPEMFSEIVDFDREAYLKKVHENESGY